jgi:hypothetical protein
MAAAGGGGSSAAAASGPVFVSIDGSKYMQSMRCTVDMTSGGIMAALKSDIFADALDGLDLWRCEVLFMGTTEPAPGTPAVRNLSGAATPASVQPDLAQAFVYLDTTNARAHGAAGAAVLRLAADEEAARALATCVTPSSLSTRRDVDKQADFINFDSRDRGGLASWAQARVLCGRLPGTWSPLPLTIIEPEFGCFYDAASSGGGAGLTDGMYVAAAHLMDAMAAQYRDGGHRNVALLAHTQKLMPAGLSIAKMEIGAGATDGSVRVSGFLAANLELKHSGDPDLQNLAHMLQLNVKERGRMPSALGDVEPRAPCFLLDVYGGAVMIVRGAVVCSPCVISEPLATVSLVGRRHSAAHCSLARALEALRSGIRALELRYRRVCADEEPPVELRVPAAPRNVGGMRVVPVRIPRWGEEGATPYVVRLGEQLADGRLAFVATFVRSDGLTWDGGCGCAAVVKFARGRYGADAHAAAAAAGFAPRLLGVEPDLPGGWVAVLMEQLRQADGWQHARALPRAMMPCQQRGLRHTRRRLLTMAMCTATCAAATC